MQRKIYPQLLHFKTLECILSPNFTFPSLRSMTVLVDEEADPLYTDLPRPRATKSERKPYPTPMKTLIRRAKEDREARKSQPCSVLQEPPDNGLLVPQLVEVAHRVHRARDSLLLGVSKLIHAIPVKRCRYCFEVHIGIVGHEIRTCTGPKSGFRNATHVWRRGAIRDVIYFPNCFHLYDRVGKPRVGHDEQHTVRRVPAIIELCIQAGLDLEKYPARRRTKPVYSIEGRIVDFEPGTEMDETKAEMNCEDCSSVLEISSEINSGKAGNESNLEHAINSQVLLRHDEGKSLRDIGIMTLESWFQMISGAKEIMEKYRVWTCGYCPEVQVGPKGHKVRMCKASKHQSRNGLHAWQEATIDDLVGPNYVWHVLDLTGPPLVNNLKRYYGKAPAVVELCVQAGAPIPDQYRSMMRVDVVPPGRDEVDLVT